VNRWRPGVHYAPGSASGVPTWLRGWLTPSHGRHVSGPLAEVLRRPAGRVDRSERVRVLAAVLAVVAAESLVAFVDPVAGAVAHGLLLVVFLLRWVLAEEATILVLALAPLGRLTSLALTPQYYEPATYALTGFPLLLAVLWMSRGFPGSIEQARPTPAWPAVAVALAGIPLGWAAHALLPLPVLDDPDAALTIAVGVPVTFLFAGVLEELLFRGLVLRTLERPFGVWAIVLADVLFVAAYLPVRDPGVLAFMAVVGLAFGEYVRRTRLLAPVAIAHGLMAASALVIFPVVA
jgi:membrane protease YdiL (CAAX protease family)